MKPLIPAFLKLKLRVAETHLLFVSHRCKNPEVLGQSARAGERSDQGGNHAVRQTQRQRAKEKNAGT